MTVLNAKRAAERRAAAEAARLPGFVGTFRHGSVNWLPEDADLPPTSDVDVMVVLEGQNPPDRPGKFAYQGALLEVSYLPSDRVRSAEQVLGDYHLAGSFRTPSVILDPSGRLASLQPAVSEGYARRSWVRTRCDHARRNSLACLRALVPTAPFQDQVTAWLFAAGVTTHVLLVAGLRNPTVRLRYLAVRNLLAEYGRLEFHESLLATLGCVQMRQDDASRHLDALEGAFDAAKTAIRTPYPYAADLTDIACPVAIGGSRDLIERGDHREAIFWMLATYSRCQSVLARDAPIEVQEEHARGYHRLLADLGVSSSADLQQRGEQVRLTLPGVWDMAEAIMEANPAIE
ncbi:MAG TPA: hypothetical protein VGM37_12880 [Armatimonadota bacterium]|jgi:hypothetical protein